MYLMNNIMQKLSFKLHELIYKMAEDELVKCSLEKFGTPLKKEYIKLLFSAYKATTLENYEDEENILTVLEVNSHIKLFLNELQRLEIKCSTSKYLRLINEKAKEQVTV